MSSPHAFKLAHAVAEVLAGASVREAAEACGVTPAQLYRQMGKESAWTSRERGRKAGVYRVPEVFVERLDALLASSEPVPLTQEEVCEALPEYSPRTIKSYLATLSASGQVERQTVTVYRRIG